MTISRAILLAAGLGTRMRPLTDATAKTLLPLGGRSLLDRALDRLAEAGVERVVVNAHWQAARVASHLASRRTGPETVLLPEETLLESGGTVAAAVAAGLVGDEPFYVVNGDSAWFDGPAPALRRLAAAFDPARLDGMLMLVRATEIQSDIHRGDFMLDPLGTLRRPKPHEVAPFVFSGVQLLTARICADMPEPPVSMNPLWDRAIAAGRLAGLVHDGMWFHLSTPRDLEEAEQALEARLADVPA